MTSEEFGQLALLLKASYSGQNFLSDKETIRVWFELLKDMDFNTCKNAVMRHISTSKFPPTIADIRCVASENKHINDNEAEEAWVLVYKAIGNSIYNSVEEYNKLPKLVQKTVGGSENLRELAIADEESVLCEKGRFIKQYNAMKKREIELDSMPDSVRQLITANQVRGIEDGHS